MNRYFFVSLTLVVAATFGGRAVAQMYPLPATTGDRTSTESTAPFLVPEGVKQKLLTDRRELTFRGLPPTFANWDMVAYDATGRFIFVPTEVGSGTGLFRFDTVTKDFRTLLLGDGTGVRESDPTKFDATKSDYARLDPAIYTPWGTILTAEETTGGRLFEIMNPMANSNIDVRWRSNIPAIAHEGVRFDSKGVLYVIDEDNSGSIYKFVPRTPGDLSVGQSFVLCVDAFTNNPSADASANWDATANRSAQRFGFATWKPLTDADGKALTAADPFAFVTTTGGRTAADEVKGTPYGRPEDIDVGRLANGNDVVYCSVTSENRVLSIELFSDTSAIVRVFCDFDTINLATGKDVNPQQNDPYTSPGPSSATNFNSPDNIAIDSHGNVFVIEDQNPGDIWKCYDANRDGVAESMGLFVSLGVAGSEPTGLIQHPTDPGKMIVNIQHPSSGNDALWELQVCPYGGSGKDLQTRVGINAAATTGAGDFVRDVAANDLLTLQVYSEKDYRQAPYAMLLQILPGNQRPRQLLLPGLWMNFSQPIIVVAGGTIANFPTLLDTNGSGITFVVPFGLGGLRLVTQSLAISPDVNSGLLVLSHAHETILK